MPENKSAHSILGFHEQVLDFIILKMVLSKFSWLLGKSLKIFHCDLWHITYNSWPDTPIFAMIAFCPIMGLINYSVLFCVIFTKLPLSFYSLSWIDFDFPFGPMRGSSDEELARGICSSIIYTVCSIHIDSYTLSPWSLHICTLNVYNESAKWRTSSNSKHRKI